MPAQDAVRNASKSFYAALNSMAKGDAAPMLAVWSHSPDVTTMHPIGGREAGWNKVQGPWKQVASLCSGGKITLRGQRIHVAGSAAFETGVEKGQITMAGRKVSFEHRVTNVYRRDGRTWKIVHHHTDLSPDMIDVVRKLQAK
ncbi:MAG TPA: nuclear transport factor 2 family protein [Candidatus Eisenbacteria bacterium]|nr:nuclear transport factor 2 family protein [Candidatus Eisenbacteria bacterium]